MTRTFASIDEVQAAVGENVGYSSWVDVDQDRIDTFAAATGDHQWIHVDPVRAAEGPFGRTIAHGFLTLSLVSSLCWEIFEIGGLAMEINYGLNKVRFPAVVPAGSRVRAGAEILEVKEFGEGFQVTTQVTVEIDGSDKPGCVAETLTYAVPA